MYDFPEYTKKARAEDTLEDLQSKISGKQGLTKKDLN